MAVDAIAGFATSGVSQSVSAVGAVDQTAIAASYAGTSTAANSSVPYKGDLHDVLQAQVDDLLKAEQRQRVNGGLGEQNSGVASAASPPVTSVKEAMDQVRTMFAFSVKATLMGSVANQSVAAVTTLAKSQ